MEERFDELDRRHLHHSLAYCEHICRPSPRWQVLRGYIFIRSGGWCEMCWDQAATQVHHRTYDRLGDEAFLDLLAVCANCHRGLSHTPNAPASGKPGFATFRQLEQIAAGFNELYATGWRPGREGH
jgi:hypothetical protein